MSPSRLAQVFWLEFRYNLRRPLFWILIVIMGLTAWGLSGGSMSIGTGDSRVGGTKAWITSEFAVAKILVHLVFLIYTFFVVVAAGMPLIRDEELKVSELLYATPLLAGEYIWGKFGAVLASFLAVLGLHLLFIMFFDHLVPHERALEIRGPFALIHYLRPTLIFAVPWIFFLAGISFAIGEWTRRPIVLFVLPVAMIMACGFFLWTWSPAWLDPQINQVLMLIEPSGFRWLNESWLKGDRGVEFYNTSPIPLDGGFLASRAVFLALGLGVVMLSQIHLASTMRGSHSADRFSLKFLRVRRQKDVDVEEQNAGATAELAALHMRSGVLGFVRGAWLVGSAELRELCSQPGLYLFVPLILLQTIGANSFAVGAFDTPLLLTPGMLAVRSMNVLTVLVCLLLLFYTVESLLRERITGFAAIQYATPVRTSAILFGKAMANSFVAAAIILANLIGCMIVLGVQGQVRLTLWPFMLVWGLLLVPTFLVWTSFVTVILSATGNRYTTYGVALAALVFTGYRQMTGQMNWVGNWPLWSAIEWTDMGVLELDRTALILNRVMVLGLTVLFTALAVCLFRRRDFDATRILQRLSPLALAKTVFKLLPFGAIPAVAGITLYVLVYQGYQGEIAKKKQKDYWRKNLATWKDAVLPALTAVDVDLELEPTQSWFRVKGTYELLNHRKKPLRQIPFTGSAHWENVAWTLNGEDYQPENRSLLYVFTPTSELAPGSKLRIGFAFEGTYPSGISKNGGGRIEFILPSGVVLTSFQPSFTPVLGYLDGIGVDEKNSYEAKEYPDDFYLRPKEPAIGSPTSFTTRLRITAPEEYTVNSVGTLVKQESANGRRTVEWKSDHAVRAFNIVAGKWAVRNGEGAAVFYHREHAFNVGEMIEALDASRKYYSEWFYPYPWKELKLSEFPNLASYAQGFATNITFSEGVGFLTRIDARADAAFVITAHEAAHQWWGNTLTPGQGPGGNVLSEGMAHFSAALLLEQIKGPRARIAFLKKIEDNYEKQRSPDSERPLVKIDGTENGDGTATYDKGGWVFWMLLHHLGRERALAGLQAFIKEYHKGPDFPVLQNFVAAMRRFASDRTAYDAFVKQWFFEVVVPEYRVSEAKREQAADSKNDWEVTARVENVGTGRMMVEVAAERGERFGEDGTPSPSYQVVRTSLELGAGEAKIVKIRCPFKPERVLMDPEAFVLQLRRNRALARL